MSPTEPPFLRWLGGFCGMTLHTSEGLEVRVGPGTLTLARDGCSRTEAWPDRAAQLCRVAGLMGDGDVEADVMRGLAFALSFTVGP